MAEYQIATIEEGLDDARERRTFIRQEDQEERDAERTANANGRDDLHVVLGIGEDIFDEALTEAGDFRHFCRIFI